MVRVKADPAPDSTLFLFIFFHPPGHDNTVDDVSQDLFGPDRLVHSAALQPDSDSETPELMLEDPQPPVASPRTPTPSTVHAAPQGNSMHPHVHFLQSLCSLHGVGGSNKGLEVLWFGPDGDAGSVLVDSVCQLLDSIVTACRDPRPPLGPRELVPQACGVAAQAMDLFCSQRPPPAEFRSRVEESLRELTAELFNHNQHSRVSLCAHNIYLLSNELENSPL